MANFKISGKDVFTQTGSEEPALANNVSIPAVSGVGLKSIKPISNQDLTGTYTDHEMIIGDKFTLTGDLTINDNLVLASLSGSGQDVIIEDDGNGRTITTEGKVIECTTASGDATVTTANTADLRAGTGVTGTGIPASTTILSVTNATTFELSQNATASGTVNLTFDTAVFEAGEFLGSADLPSLADLTGEMQSSVTGSPAIHLSNATYQAGGVVNTWFKCYNTPGIVTITNAAPQSVGLDLNISVTAGNILMVNYFIGIYHISSRHWGHGMWFNGSSMGDGGSNATWMGGISDENGANFSGWDNRSGLQWLTIPTTGTFLLELKLKTNSGTAELKRDGQLGQSYDSARWVAQEIQG